MKLPPQLATNAQKQSFQHRLLAWYDSNKRDLPWRGQRDPYRVWLSEIMLQQTRVAVVIEYYERFLRRFPTLKALAAARLSTVLAAWSGLGYYRRARMMHQAAREVVKHHSSHFPQTSRELSYLPGIGRYTAAAVASIAFDEQVAVVDGNVERVLSRVCRGALTAKDAWQVAQGLLFPARAGDFNQAMMELGATICLPQWPRCYECPIHEHCCGRVQLQKAQSKPPRRKRSIGYALCCSQGRVLLTRRPKTASLMPGMWELPEFPKSATKPAPLLFKLRHSITTTDYTISVFAMSGDSPAGQLFPPSRLRSLPLTGLARKILSRAEII